MAVCDQEIGIDWDAICRDLTFSSHYCAVCRGVIVDPFEAVVLSQSGDAIDWIHRRCLEAQVRS